MRILSLFNGMGCAFMSSVEAGLDVEIIYTSDIDGFANKASKKINPGEVQLDNVWGIRDAMKFTDKQYQDVMLMSLARFMDLFPGRLEGNNEKARRKAFLNYKESLVKSRSIDWSKIDLVAGGSPCQGFSFAGKQLAFDDPRSRLYFVYEEILFHVRTLNPKVKFFLENVHMLAEHASVITNRLGIEYIRINSNHFTAQNRDRYYWTDFFPLDYGLFGEIGGGVGKPIVPKLPPPSNQVIKDILDPYGTVGQKYYLSDKYVEYLFRNAINAGHDLHIQARDSNEKTLPLVASMHKGPRRYDTIVSEYGSLEAKASCLTGAGKSAGQHGDMDVICEKPGGFQWFLKNLKHNSEKANAILATSNKGPYANGTTVVMERKISQVNPSKEFGNGPSQPNRIYDDNGLSPVLDTKKSHAPIIIEQKRELTPRFTKDAKAFWFEKSGGGVASEFGVIPVDHDIKANALITAKPSFIVEDYKSQFRLRRLTPSECCRLQGIPEWAMGPFLSSNSDTQLYKMLGNGWTVPVIAWFFKHLKI